MPQLLQCLNRSIELRAAEIKIVKVAGCLAFTHSSLLVAGNQLQPHYMAAAPGCGITNGADEEFVFPSHINLLAERYGERHRDAHPNPRDFEDAAIDARGAAAEDTSGGVAIGGAAPLLRPFLGKFPPPLQGQGMGRFLADANARAPPRRVEHQA